MRKVVLVVLIFVLTGCAASGAYFRSDSVKNLGEKSEIIVYRMGKVSASGSNFCTKINGDSLGVLQNGGFLRKKLEPGTHTVTMPWDESLTIEVSTEPGKVSYVEFTIGLDGMGVLPIGTVTAVSMSWNMALISKKPAESLRALSTLRESTYSTTCTK